MTAPSPKEALKTALHEVSVYGIGGTSDKNQKVIVDAAKAALASGLVQDEAGIRADEREKCDPAAPHSRNPWTPAERMASDTQAPRKILIGKGVPSSYAYPCA